jgi:DNA-binding MarR family transcriptional regulator
MFIEKRDKELKEAFEKVKKDIFTLGNEISSLRLEILEVKEGLKLLEEHYSRLVLSETAPTITPIDNYSNPTHQNTPTDNPTVPLEIGGLKWQDFDTSIGNEGVPTDRQTNQQTVKQTSFKGEKSINQKIFDASEILNSLDSIRKEIRLKFKAMTQQEMLVFSTIYQLEEQSQEGVEYGQIAAKLGLSPSSIRDYTQRLVSKGIPILKEKVNNKKILLRISPELKKITSLQTIIQLRGI